jgi:hypothetical protein
LIIAIGLGIGIGMSIGTIVEPSQFDPDPEESQQPRLGGASPTG